MSLAMAYLAFYVANLPLGVSGVTAVVVLGLFGSATGKWQMCVLSRTKLHSPVVFSPITAPLLSSCTVVHSCADRHDATAFCHDTRASDCESMPLVAQDVWKGASYLEVRTMLDRACRSPQVAEAGYFFSFWDTVSYAVNGLVFFFAGASAVNFFVRCGDRGPAHTQIGAAQRSGPRGTSGRFGSA